jgi:hypothetical protein
VASKAEQRSAACLAPSSRAISGRISYGLVTGSLQRHPAISEAVPGESPASDPRQGSRDETDVWKSLPSQNYSEAWILVVFGPGQRFSNSDKNADSRQTATGVILVK